VTLRFAAPALPDDPLPAAVVAAPALTVAEAAERYYQRHLAAARMLQRNPPGRPVDSRDAAAHVAADARCAEIPAAMIPEAWEAFRARHDCRVLEQCPLGPNPRGGARK
jgi:hypothetical protein